MKGKLRTFKTDSQNTKILAYLKLGNTLTVSQARELGFGDNLRSRVSNLHEGGYDVASVKVPTNSSYIAEYSILEHVNQRSEIEEIADMEFYKIHTIHKDSMNWHMVGSLSLEEVLRLLKNGYTAIPF